MSDVVNIGTAANSGNGDPLRQAFTLVNTRFQELLGTLTGRGVWVTATVYAATPTREWVTNAGTAYVCAENHTSGTFATDLAAGKWLAVDVTQLISDLAATSATKGAAMIGSDDGASGTLWTTVKGFITRLLGANGAAMVGNTPAGSIAATTVQAAINELATEKITAGAITGSGLTMTTARVLMRTTAGTGAPEEKTSAEITAFLTAATTTAQGASELATTAETQTGSDAARTVTPAGLKGALLFSKGFESSDQTVTATSKLTIAHGLGAKPKLFQTVLKCNTAEANYTAGDEIEFTNMDVAGVSTCSTSVDATNLYLVHIGAIRVNDKNTPFTATTITTTNWRWVLRAWA